MKKSVKNQKSLNEQLVDYLLNENLETLTRISFIEKRFEKMWKTNDCDERMNEESNQWSNELKEQWGKISLIMKLFKDFGLDEGRNSETFKVSKVGGDCYYTLKNYEVEIEDRTLSKNKFYLPDNTLCVEEFNNENKILESIK
jgi:hypothetical protein